MEEPVGNQRYKKLLQFYTEIVMNVVHVYFEREFVNKDLYTFLKNHLHILFHIHSPGTKCCQCTNKKHYQPSNMAYLGADEFAKLYHSSGNVKSGHVILKNEKIKQICLCEFEPKTETTVPDLDIIIIYAIVTSCFNELSQSPPCSPALFKKIKDIRNDLFHEGSGHNMPLKQFKEKWRILENVSLQIAEGTGTSHKQGITQRIHQFKADKGMIDDIIAVLREEKEEIKEAISAAMKDEHEQMKYCIGQLEYNIRDLQIQIVTGTGVANQEKKKSGKSVYFVKWTLDNADSSIIDRIKLNLQNVPQLSEFEILRVYGGSVQIESSISYVIFHNPENIVSCIFEFLKMVAILCKVDTSKNATIDVDIVVSDIPWNDKIKDMPVKMACDELRETVNRYLSHSQKKWKHCATVSVPMVITESVSVSIVKTDYKEEVC